MKYMKIAIAGLFGLLWVVGTADCTDNRSSFADCSDCPLMIEVPQGSFTQGSPSSEEGHTSDEGPQHEVRIGYRLAVGVYEVSFAEWDTCVASGGCNGYRPPDEGWGRGKRPVIRVSWEDVQSYVDWLSLKTGHPYRLLSESEWEYVARAGTSTSFYYGETISPDQANYRENGLGQTLPVGSYPANAFGLYDVNGNVWEWLQDCWNDSYSGAPSDGSAWESEQCRSCVLRGGTWYGNVWKWLQGLARDLAWESEQCRVLRGGAWGTSPLSLRSANRSRGHSGYRFDGSGFRVCRTLSATERLGTDH